MNSVIRNEMYYSLMTCDTHFILYYSFNWLPMSNPSRKPKYHVSEYLSATGASLTLATDDQDPTLPLLPLTAQVVEWCTEVPTKSLFENPSSQVLVVLDKGRKDENQSQVPQWWYSVLNRYGHCSHITSLCTSDHQCLVITTHSLLRNLAPSICIYNFFPQTHGVTCDKLTLGCDCDSC